MAEKVIAACGGSVQGKTIAVLGLTFKPETDDMRDSPSLEIVTALQAAGATVRTYDPEGMVAAKKLLKDLVWGTDSYEEAQGAAALVIITEGNQCRALALARLHILQRTPPR